MWVGVYLTDPGTTFQKMSLVFGDSLATGLGPDLPGDWHVETYSGASTEALADTEFGLAFLVREAVYTRVFVVSGANDVGGTAAALARMRGAVHPLQLVAVDVNGSLAHCGVVADLHVTAATTADGLHLSVLGRRTLADALCNAP